MQVQSILKTKELIINSFQPNTEESTQDPFADIDQEDILVQRIDPDVPLTVWEYATADDVLLVQHL